jgi:hypothetical protein
MRLAAIGDWRLAIGDWRLAIGKITADAAVGCELSTVNL